MHRVGIFAILFVSVHCSSLELLLREIEELDHVDREMQITKRVSDVMTLLTAPLERNLLLERGVEGTMCEDGVMATCKGSTTCSADGTEGCNPLCDSDDHEGKGHFYCKCKSDFTAKLCNVPKKEAEGKCTKCKADQGGFLCYTTSGSSVGYFCYDKDYKTLTVTKRGLEEREDPEGEELGRIARVLHAYINEAL